MAARIYSVAFAICVVAGSYLVFPSAAHARVCRWQVDGKWTLFQRNGARLPMNLRQIGDVANGSTFGGAALGNGDVRAVIVGKHFLANIFWQNGQQGFYNGNVETQWNRSQQSFVLKGWTADVARPSNHVEWWKSTPMFYRCTPN
jgi:hypothetical protein